MKTKQYISAWVKYHQAKAELDALKPEIISELEIFKTVETSGYTLSLSERPVFTNVTLDTARKYKAVKKAVDTAKLTAVLKTGKRIPGVEHTQYINVHPIK